MWRWTDRRVKSSRVVERSCSCIGPARCLRFGLPLLEHIIETNVHHMLVRLLRFGRQRILSCTIINATTFESPMLVNQALLRCNRPLQCTRHIAIAARAFQTPQGRHGRGASSEARPPKSIQKPHQQKSDSPAQRPGLDGSADLIEDVVGEDSKYGAGLEDVNPTPTKTSKNQSAAKAADRVDQSRAAVKVVKTLRAKAVLASIRQRIRNSPAQQGHAAVHTITLGNDLIADTPVSKTKNTSAVLRKNSSTLLHNTSPHHDSLPSFLEYADRTSLSSNSTVYRGTHYEYTVAERLSYYGFELVRTGKSNDLGIDLVGRWSLPSTPSELRVIVQCKATKPQPSMIRELEGAYVGAPAGWHGADVLAILVCSKEATKGVRDAVQRSRLPLCVLQITATGKVSQFLWNVRAAECGLEGLGVAVRYASKEATGKSRGIANNSAEEDIAGNSEYSKGVQEAIVLTWLGNPWRPEVTT